MDREILRNKKMAPPNQRTATHNTGPLPGSKPKVRVERTQQDLSVLSECNGPHAANAQSPMPARYGQSARRRFPPSTGVAFASDTTNTAVSKIPAFLIATVELEIAVTKTKAAVCF